jgi:hypothetical protein
MLGQGALGAEVESGYFKADAPGTQPEILGFKPDYIEFYAQQKTEGLDQEQSSSSNNNCPQNVNGWSEGAALFESGAVQKQFSIAAARNSDSTNDHRIASSTSHVIKMPYAGRNGGKCGELRISIASVSTDGFSYDIESRYQFDEIVRYKAYRFPDNMEFDAGMVKIKSRGSRDISTSFRPANLHIRAAQQITSKNSDTQFDDNDPESDNTLGRSKGYATLDSAGSVVNQQSIGTASSSDSTNAHRSIASDDYILNTAYVGQDGNLFGRLRAKVTGSDSAGFSLQVDDKWSGTDDIFLYRAWGFSFYDFEIGYDVVTREGQNSYVTGFEPDAIDLYSEQQIESIDQEVVTGNNNGCDNAGGWSYGYYDTNDSKQWSLSTGRSSDSQNAHRYGASTQYAINNIYSGQSAQDCGNFQGQVVSTSSSGFAMDFSFDSDFQNNYAKELFYYRALDFRTAPPRINTIDFSNSSVGHSFTVNATINEGSNDLDKCKIDATEAGRTQQYSGVVRRINSSWSRCTYSAISYDDTTVWENEHDDNRRLLSPEIEVNATDTGGNYDVGTNSNTFPNHEPSVESFDYSEIRQKYAFNTSIRINDTDDGADELDACELTFDDGSSSFTVGGELSSSPSSSDLYTCNYSNTNNTFKSSFDVLEEIDINVEVRDIHGGRGSGSSQNEIPNTEPEHFPSSIHPENDTPVTESPVTIEAGGSDPEGDEVALYFINATGTTNQVLKKVSVSSTPADYSGSYDWNGVRIREPTYWYINLSDPYTNYTSPTFSFEKVTASAFRVSIEVPERYRTISTTEQTKKSLTFTVENPSARNKNLEVSMHGVNASFENGQPSNTVSIGPGSSETFTATVETLKTGSRELVINATNIDTLLSNKRTIPVNSEQPTATIPGNPTQTPSTREVPGIAAIQAVSIGLAALFLFQSV